jgi:hypothetical protein
MSASRLLSKKYQMEPTISLIEPLLERAEMYAKTSIELLKLKSIHKTADITSTLISRLLLTIVLSLFALTLNIGVALWIGDLLEKAYFGFLVVAAFYALIGIILFFIHPIIKSRLNNSIIIQILN